jgi:hypothetical protein
MIIISGILQENPFIVSSDEFLRGLRERRANWPWLACKQAQRRLNTEHI